MYWYNSSWRGFLWVISHPSFACWNFLGSRQRNLQEMTYWWIHTETIPEKSWQKHPEKGIGEDCKTSLESSTKSELKSAETTSVDRWDICSGIQVLGDLWSSFFWANRGAQNNEWFFSRKMSPTICHLTSQPLFLSPNMLTKRLSFIPCSSTQSLQYIRKCSNALSVPCRAQN